MNILKLFSQPEIDNAVRIKSQTAFTGSYIDTIFDIIFHQDRGRFIVPSNLILAAMEVEELRARAEIAEHIENAGLTDLEVAGLPADITSSRAEIERALMLVLDQIDYTAGNCRPNEMVGAVLDSSIIAIARKSLAVRHD